MSFAPVRGAVALVFLALALPRAAAANPETFAAAKALAAKEGKPLLVDFYATWCGPCKRFAQEAQTDADVQKSLGSVVLFKTDAEKGEGAELAKSQIVQAYPTFVLMNASGSTMERWMGYEKSFFLQTLASAMADPTTIEEKHQRFAKSPTAADAAKLADFHSSRGEMKQALELTRRAAQIEPTPERNLAVVEGIAYGLRTKEFTVEELEKERDAFLARSPKDPMVLLRFAKALEMGASYAGKPEVMVPAIEPALAATASMEDPEAIAFRKSLLIDKALWVEKDHAKAVRLKKESMPEGWMEDPSRLNGFAWWCFENHLNLAEAEAMARKGTELAPAGPDRAMILDTLAEILAAEGKRSEAVSAIEQAVKEDPSRESYKKQLERFQGMAPGTH